MQYINIFSAVKIENFSGEKNYIFDIVAQNIHCVYMLEPPHGSNGSCNEYPQ